MRWYPSLLLGSLLFTGCADTALLYPPALPAQTPEATRQTPLAPVLPPLTEMPPRPAPRRVPGLIPTDAEWSLWEPVPTAQEVCHGTGKARKCVPRPSSVVQQAQASALIRPTRRAQGGGRSAMTTYEYQPGGIYWVEVSTYAGTHLILPQHERLRLPPVLNKEMFVVGTDDTPEDETTNDILALRARQAPQPPVDVPLIFRSGLILVVRLVTVEGQPMSLVQWNVPEAEPVRAELPMTARPPRFDDRNPYLGYTLSVGGKDAVSPPWLPVAIADDGSNTLIKFSRALDWTRAPVVVGVAQNGKPVIAPNRYWTKPDAPDEGAWLFVQGLWPALTLKDSAGLTVTITRQPPVQTAGAGRETP